MNQDDVERLQRVFDFRQRGLHVVDGDAGAFRQMAEVEHDAVAIAVFERNALGPGRVVAHVAERIHVRADVVADHDEAVRREPVDAELRGADAFGELLPGFVHHQRRPDDARKADHVVVHRHAEIDEFWAWQLSYCVAVMPPSSKASGR